MKITADSSADREEVGFHSISCGYAGDFNCFRFVDLECKCENGLNASVSGEAAVPGDWRRAEAVLQWEAGPVTRPQQVQVHV